MPICPECKSEYLKGYDTCADCQVKLVDRIKENKKIEETIDSSLVFLKNVSDDYQKDLIISFLESENISVIEEHKGIGQYLKIYSGQNYQGKNLYVHKEDFESAKELIESIKFKRDISETPREDYVLEYNRKLKRRKKFLQGFIFIIFFVPLLFTIIFNLFG
jgi:uncharacterized protein YlbG (UPF0298 family)